MTRIFEVRPSLGRIVEKLGRRLDALIRRDPFVLVGPIPARRCKRARSTDRARDRLAAALRTAAAVPMPSVYRDEATPRR